MLDEELDTCQELFKDQMNNFRNYGQFIVDKYMPPVAGSLKWTHQLRQRITIPMSCFKSLQHPIVEFPESIQLINKYEQFMIQLAEFDSSLYDAWSKVVPRQIAKNLKQPLVTRNTKTKELHLNFHPQV
ncbi:Dynein heavy chain at 93AB [Carabus blaptoides fortunei]